MTTAFAFYVAQLDRHLQGCGSVLDLGCGDDSPLGSLSVRPPRLVATDGHAPSIQRSTGKGIHDEYHLLDLTEVRERFAPSSFDAVVALDVIEHLPRDQGWDLIAAMEAIARSVVVLFTPNGFLPQAAFDDNAAQRHLSGWTSRDLRGAGFDVIGLRGLKPLRGGHAVPRIRPRLLGERISHLTQPLVTRRPAWAFQLLAVKRTGPPVTG